MQEISKKEVSGKENWRIETFLENRVKIKMTKVYSQKK